VNDEVTRASSADRERFADHLPALYAKGFISQEQLDEKLGLVLTAETLAQLDGLLEGLPYPVPPPRPRDYKIPRNFIPVCAGWSLTGMSLAVIPVTALAHSGSALANTVSAFCLVWGLWIALVSVITVFVKWYSWDDLDGDEKTERLRKDAQGRRTRGGNT